MQHRHGTVRNQNGDPVDSATVNVYLTGTETAAALYSDQGTTSKTNPLTTDSLGKFDFYVADGRYDFKVSGSGLTTVTYSDEEVADVTGTPEDSDTDWQVRVFNEVRYASAFEGANAGAKIAAAITDLPAGGGIVDARGFGAGEQTFSATLTINKAVHLICDSATTFKLANGVNANMVNITANGVTLDGCKLDGNRANQTAGVGINATSVSNLSLRNITVQSTFDKWFQGSALTNARISGFYVENAGAGAQVNGVSGNSTGVWFENGKVDQSASDKGCIQFASSTGGNTLSAVHIDNVECIVGDDAAADTIGLEFFNSNGGIIRDFSATNNKVRGENATNTGVFGISSGGTAANNREGSFQNNTVKDARKFGIEVIAVGFSSIGNQLKDNGRSKIGGGSQNVKWQGNTHTGSSGSGNGNQQLEIDNSAGQKNLSILGNTFSGFYLYAIHFNASTGTTGFEIAGGNIFDGLDSATANMAAVRIEGADIGAVHDNIYRDISGANGRGLLITATAGTSIEYWGSSYSDIALNNVLNQALSNSTVENLLRNDILFDGTTSDWSWDAAGGLAPGYLTNSFDFNNQDLNNGGKLNALRLFASKGTALVAGDFALSAGWGTTASLGNIGGTDQFHRFTITSAGTGQGASPTITLTFKDGTWTTAPIVICNRQSFASQPTVTFTVTTVTATTYILTFNGTPVAAETYSLACHVGGI